ncbi:ketosteroid isomerase-like protein [Catenulispora sp. GP43]|uniref:nuclear transport factor 2 family protein n=1 Tax=Catenulispora sp. GP43 TaxID=3156263 RepID=UPI003517B916
MAEHPHIALVRRGYEAFNKGDVDTLREIIARDCVQHVGGDSLASGEFKGVDAMLAYYARLAELTGGTFRAAPELFSTDGNGHVIVVHRLTGTRGDKTLDQRGALLFQIADDKAVDLLQCDTDLDESDRFWS